MDIASLYFRTIIGIGDIIGQNVCVVCGKLGDVFCKKHFDFLTENSIFSNDRHWWFWLYSGKSRELIIDIKHHHRFRVGYRLGQYLGHELINKGLNHLFQYITYVPHHYMEFARNKFSLPFLLATGISDILNVPILHVFEKIKKHSQHILSAQERRSRLKDVYNISRYFVHVLKTIKGPILIVDDIITTGSTLITLKNMLLSEGVKSVYTLTLAKTPKWSDIV